MWEDGDIVVHSDLTILSGLSDNMAQRHGV